MGTKPLCSCSRCVYAGQCTVRVPVNPEHIAKHIHNLTYNTASKWLAITITTTAGTAATTRMEAATTKMEMGVAVVEAAGQRVIIAVKVRFIMLSNKEIHANTLM